MKIQISTESVPLSRVIPNLIGGIIIIWLSTFWYDYDELSYTMGFFTPIVIVAWMYAVAWVRFRIKCRKENKDDA